MPKTNRGVCKTRAKNVERKAHKRTVSSDTSSIDAEGLTEKELTKNAIKVTEQLTRQQNNSEGSLAAKMALVLFTSSVDEKFIRCQVCLERYIRPKYLSCMHTFCEHCVNSHIQKAAKKKEVGQREFPCPKCKAYTRVNRPELPLDKWAETLPVNKMMEALLESISLQVDDKLCGSCQEVGDTTTASFWCRDCAEPLCDDCLQYHKRMKVSRKHKTEEMNTLRRNPKRILSVPQPCPDHTGKDIELFCADHNTLCCVMCVATDHRRCEKVSSIDILAKEIEEGAVTEELVDKLQSYLDHLKAMAKNRESNMEALKNKKNEILEQITNFKENVNILLEKLESTITEDFTALHARETDRLKTEMEWCDGVEAAVDNAKIVLQMTNKHCSNAQVFVTVQQVIERTIRYEEQLAIEQNERFEQLDYSFEIDPLFEAFLQSLISVESVGKVHVHRRKAFVPSPPGVSFLRDRTAHKHLEFDAKTPTDTRNCCLSSALFLSDKRILLADQNNQKIKLFKDDGDLIYEQAFTTWPRDITELGNNKVAVTLPKERKIEVFYLGDKLKNLETLRMVDECWGITFTNGHLIVACINQNKGSLKFLTLDGVEVECIEDDADGNRLFIKTNYVTANNTGREICVTDRTKDAVVVLAQKRSRNKLVPGEDQAPKRIVPRRPRQRSSTVLSNRRDQHDKKGFRLKKTGPSDAMDKTGSPEEMKRDRKFDDSFDSTTTPYKDLKSMTLEEIVSLKTEDMDAMKNSFDREDSISIISEEDDTERESTEYEILYSYSNEILKSAGGVAVDHQGNIYVTGYRSANVHQISPGGSLIKILLQHLCQPLAIAVEPYGEKLLVTETSSARQNLVQLYQLT